MKTKLLPIRIPTSIVTILLVLLLLTVILYYTGIFPVQASQIATPTPEGIPLELTPTPIPVDDVGDTTGLVIWGAVIVMVILAGLFWPRGQQIKKSS